MLLKTIALCLAIVLSPAAAPRVVAQSAPAQGGAPNGSLLRALLGAHLQTRRALHAVIGTPLDVQGTLEGLGQPGSFHHWRSGDDQRDDRALGIRTQRTLRIGGRGFAQNANGDVRELTTQSVRRQVSAAFVESGEFARHPETAVLLGSARLDDGRAVVQLRVAAPGGDAVGVALDDKTALVDEIAVPSGGGLQRTDYYDYRVADGALYPAKSVETDGDGASHVTQAAAQAHGGPIDPAIFAPLVSTTIETNDTVVLPLLFDSGHLFVRALVLGHPLLFLIDSGSQGLFIDVAAARRAGLIAEGAVRVQGAKAMSGAVAPLRQIDFAGASLPAAVVFIADLSDITYRGEGIDGVLGYPFFAAAEVRIDAGRLTMQLAKPGGLPAEGTRVPLDTQREVPETIARVNDAADGRFVVDTGNAAELLIFHDFVRAHPGLISVIGTGAFSSGNRAVGGGAPAVLAVVDRLRLGTFDLYHRRAEVFLNDSGAFSGTWDAGNIGLGTLSNFVLTFDLAHGVMYLQKAWNFDDGRYRRTR